MAEYLIGGLIGVLATVGVLIVIAYEHEIKALIRRMRRRSPVGIFDLSSAHRVLTRKGWKVKMTGFLWKRIGFGIVTAHPPIEEGDGRG